MGEGLVQQDIAVLRMQTPQIHSGSLSSGNSGSRSHFGSSLTRWLGPPSAPCPRHVGVRDVRSIIQPIVDGAASVYVMWMTNGTIQSLSAWIAIMAGAKRVFLASLWR